MTPCPYDPRDMAGQPIGMFHCPDCGDMVVAGLAHPVEDPSTWADLAVSELLALDPGVYDGMDEPERALFGNLLQAATLYRNARSSRHTGTRPAVEPALNSSKETP